MHLDASSLSGAYYPRIPYGFYFLSLSRARLSVIYRKSKTTISSWIHEYEENGLLTEAQRTRVFRKFNAEQRNWIVKLYLSNPVLFLDECCELFLQHFNTTISAGSVCCILHAEGLTWKALERRAIQVREDQIFHFFSELSSIEWNLYHLVFLDEASLDSRDMLRNRGYGVKGKKIIFRGQFVRRPRISFLCFLGQQGMFRQKGRLQGNFFFNAVDHLH